MNDDLQSVLDAIAVLQFRQLRGSPLNRQQVEEILQRLVPPKAREQMLVSMFVRESERLQSDWRNSR